MKIATKKLFGVTLAALGVAAMTMGPRGVGAAELADAAAAADLDADAGALVERDAVDLRDALRPVAPVDPDFVDSALVFNNPRRHRTTVVCAGFNANGRVVGRAHTHIPANGVRVIFASDLSNDRDFIGSAACKARSRVIPTAFIIGGGLGAGLTDAAARVARNWNDTFIRFPIVAHF